MSAADWRSADAYKELQTLDASAFAYEFLRRNREFMKHHERLLAKSRHRPLNAKEADAFAERWGVRFRKGFTRFVTRHRQLDTQSAGGCGRPDRDDRRADKSRRRTRITRF